MAFKYEIKTYGDPQYYGNSVVFETADEAHQAGRDKQRAWTLAEDYRVVETDAKVNYMWVEGVGLVAV